jgi:branched-chain amino acid transport system permease protein
MLLQLLNGLQLAMLLFLLSVGLSVVLGLMNFVNLAHGTIFMVGAYVGWTAAQLTGSFWGGFVAGPLASAALGVLLYALLFRRLQGASPLKQVLVTFGLIFVGYDGVRLLWGDYALSLPEPTWFSGSVELFGATYPTYRLFIIGLGLAVAALLYLGLERTRLGAIVRAGVEDRIMVSSLGIDIDRAFFVVFALGCLLAGLAGVIAAPVMSVSPELDVSVLVLALVVVVVGGPGSLKGAFAGALLVGFADTFGQVFLPELASMLIYAVMAAVLLFLPHGLVPVRGRL